MPSTQDITCPAANHVCEGRITQLSEHSQGPRGEITHSTMGADTKLFAHDLQPRFCNHDLATILTLFIIISLKEEIKSLWRQALRFSFNWLVTLKTSFSPIFYRSIMTASMIPLSRYSAKDSYVSFSKNNKNNKPYQTTVTGFKINRHQLLQRNQNNSKPNHNLWRQKVNKEKVNSTEEKRKVRI